MRKFAVILLLGIFVGCGVTQEEVVEIPPRNLAILMKDLRYTAAQLRISIVNKTPLEEALVGGFEDMKSAKPTDPEVTGPAFEAFVDAFQSTVKPAVTVDSLQVKHYNNMINACIACHQQYCPGPIKAIKHMKLKE